MASNDYGYGADSDPKKIPKRKTALVGKTNAKQKAYYTKQRKDAEAGEKRGNDSATRTAAKIHSKIGRRLTGMEADLTQKPGASEGEQMGNLAMGLGGIGDVGGIVMRGLSRAVEDVASHSALAARSGGSEGRMALPSGSPRSELGPAMRRMKLSAGRDTRGVPTQARPRPVEARTGGPNKLGTTKRLALPKPKTAAKAASKPRPKRIAAKAKKKVPVA